MFCAPVNWERSAGIEQKRARRKIFLFRLRKARAARTTLVRPVAALHRIGRGEIAGSAQKVRLVFWAGLRYHVGMPEESLENIARKLADAVPEGLRSIRADLEQNFRAVLKASLNKLDLVTREEFEVQEAVLAKTREKLEALERQVEELEGK